MSVAGLLEDEDWVPVEGEVRQQVLVLYLAGSALDARVLAWSVYDGATTSRPETGECDHPPYRTGLDALRRGWQLLSMSQLLRPGRGLEYSTDHHNFECVFVRLVAPRPSRQEER